MHLTQLTAICDSITKPPRRFYSAAGAQHTPQVLSGMEGVQYFDGPREMSFGENPNPTCGIADNDDLAGLAYIAACGYPNIDRLHFLLLGLPCP